MSTLSLFSGEEGELQMSPGPPTTADEHEHASDFSSRCAFLEASLAAGGLPDCGHALGDLLRAGERAPLDTDQRSALLDWILELSRARSQAVAGVTQATHDGERLRSDLAHASVRVTDLKEEKADAERRAWEVEMKRRGEGKEAAAREKALRADLLALDKKYVMVQRRDNQYKHELRKVEQSFEKIQEKLHKIILEKTSGSTFGGVQPLGSTQRGAAASQAPNGGWEMTSTVKLSARGGSSGGGNNSSNAADMELLQNTLATYSERMSQLVSENLAVKAALKQLEHQLQDVLDEPAVEGADEEAEQALDENGMPVARELLCLSPRSRQLLADFTPQQIELPWELAGADVETVLRAKLQLVHARVTAQREAAVTTAASQRETDALDLLKQRVGEQEQIIREQDVMLRAALAAPQRDEALQQEREEARRLSLRVDAEDARRRRAAAAAATGAPVTTPNAFPLASPVSLRILGGRSAANIPILATPIFPRKQPSSDASNVATTTAAAAATQGPPKSKWLAGGVVMTPSFTPSKRSTMRAGATVDEDEWESNSDLSAIDFAEEFEFDPRPDEDADSLALRGVGSVDFTDAPSQF